MRLDSINMKPKMSAREFEVYYANNSGITVQRLRELGRVVVRCTCGEDDCQGWISLSRDIAEFYMQSMPGLHGYRYPHEDE